MKLGAIFVRPEHHGMGVGRQLMDFVSDFHDEMEVEVFERNKVGKAFYDKYGFEVLEELVHKETNNRILRLRYRK